MNTTTFFSKGHRGLQLALFSLTSFLTIHHIARMGKKHHELVHEGKRYRFTPAENMAQFEKSPATYLPAYASYCAWAMADGKKALINPLACKNGDHKLYLSYNASIQKKWEADIKGFIAKADTQ